MSELKVFSKHYPPDFDPAKIPARNKRAGTKLQPVQLMAPFTMRCNNCKETIYRRTKFNARKETRSDVYLGNKVFRFYIRCRNCNAEISFKTDPEYSRYEVERGAIRLFESYEETKKKIDYPEELDEMAKLERKRKASIAEWDSTDFLDEVQDKNLRSRKFNHRLQPKDILKWLDGVEESGGEGRKKEVEEHVRKEDDRAAQEFKRLRIENLQISPLQKPPPVRKQWKANISTTMGKKPKRQADLLDRYGVQIREKRFNLL
jgi:Saf4/Yju2 protein